MFCGMALPSSPQSCLAAWHSLNCHTHVLRHDTHRIITIIICDMTLIWSPRSCSVAWHSLDHHNHFLRHDTHFFATDHVMRHDTHLITPIIFCNMTLTRSPLSYSATWHPLNHHDHFLWHDTNLVTTMVTMVTIGGDLQPGCLADRLLTGLGQPQINP
jgi:hypothetical protein